MTDALVDRFVLFYASQTGNAEWIAKSLDKTAHEKGYSCRCLEMDSYAEVELDKEQLLVFVVSTTGDGDPPDNSLKFWRWLRRNKQPEPLAHVRYAILGLGDTNYENFCNTARRLDAKLQEMKAQSFYPTGKADDATGLEEVVDPWIEGFWPALAKVCRQTTAAATTPVSTDNNSSNPVSKLSSVLVAPSSSTPPTVNTPALQDVVASTSLETEIKSRIDALTTKVTKLATHQDKATSDTTPYPAYTMDLDTAALDDGLSKLTNLAKSPPALCKLVDTTSVQADTPRESPVFFAPPSPLLYARLKGARTLTAPTAVKRTLHLTLAIMANADESSAPLNEELDLLPGDAFGIICQNDPRLVQAILEQLNATDNADQPITVESLVEADALPSHLSLAGQLATTTRRELLTHALDLTGVLRKTTLRLLADVATDLTDKKKLLYLSSKQGSDAFKKLRDQQPTLLDLLLTFPSAKPSVDRLVDALPALQPRSYSCTNTPLTHPRELHFAFNVADYTDKYKRHRLGVCTPWLDRLVSSSLKGDVSSAITASLVRVYLRPNVTNFRVPDSSIHRPLILVGPGTGVAPFIGFLAHRAEQRRLRLAMGGIARVPRQAVDAAFGAIYLFYGCRDDRLDFLYQYEIEQAKTNGTLTELILAISRREEHAHRRYVQDGLRERATLIWQLMTEKQAMIFVCGDATNMAKDVNNALVDIIKEQGQLSDTKAALEVIAEWSKEGRYLRDLWA